VVISGIGADSQKKRRKKEASRAISMEFYSTVAPARIIRHRLAIFGFTNTQKSRRRIVHLSAAALDFLSNDCDL